MVNDRSTDQTGEIAERLSAGDSRLEVLHIDEVPSGWFGKAHAARRGADLATGEVLLFTDADVLFAPDAAARGVLHLMREGLDHLSACPRIPHTGAMLQACTMAFRLLVYGTRRLWKVRDPRSSAYWGIGAYTIMSTNYYRATGGHEQVALRPDEDIRLGQFVKVSGGRSAYLDGSAVLRCVWYDSVRDFVRGLEKNLFAGHDYSVHKATATIALLTWFALSPFVLGHLFLSTGEVAAGLLLVACPLIYWSVTLTIFRRIESFPWWSVIPLPAGLLLIAYALGRSMLLNIRRGVTWGVLSIPVAEARAARVRPLASLNRVARLMRAAGIEG